MPTRTNRVAAEALGSVRRGALISLTIGNSDMLMFKCRDCCSNSAHPSRKRSAFERVLFRYSCSGRCVANTAASVSTLPCCARCESVNRSGPSRGGLSPSLPRAARRRPTGHFLRVSHRRMTPNPRKNGEPDRAEISAETKERVVGKLTSSDIGGFQTRT